MQMIEKITGVAAIDHDVDRSTHKLFEINVEQQ